MNNTEQLIRDLETTFDRGTLAREAAAQLRDFMAKIETLQRWKSTHAPRIVALEGLKDHAQLEAAKGIEARATLESERQANAILTTENEAMRNALELIAAPVRLDGTWNRDRAACQHLAVAALGRKA